MNEQVSLPAPPGSVTELLERLDAVTERLPKRLKQCATFTRRHIHLIAVSTVSDMARACEVAPSVYMRFCQALGFSGYTEMQALFRARYTEFRPNYDERIANLREEGAIGTERLLAEFVEAGHKSLLSLSNTVTTESVERIAQGMATARLVHLVGYRRAFAVVSNMAYILDKLGVPAMLHHSTGQLNSERAMSPEDVVFAVTYAPFSAETVTLADAAAQRGVTVYGLTDSENCPLSDFAAEMLFAREDELAGFRAPTASMTLTTAVAVSAGAFRKKG